MSFAGTYLDGLSNEDFGQFTDLSGAKCWILFIIAVRLLGITIDFVLVTITRRYNVLVRGEISWKGR